MGYSLGPVKDWVAQAANEVGPLFGIKSIGGWRAKGSVPGSLHPKGRALDLMTRDRTKGDSIAQYAIANHQRLGVTQVIWWNQIWQPESGWKPYHGPSRHEDHVHLSFGASPPDGDFPPGGIKIPDLPVDKLLPNSITTAIMNIGTELGKIGTTLASFGKLADAAGKLLLPSNMVRASAALAGTVFILIGIWFLSREVRE